MALNKVVNVLLLIAVFAVSAAVGYFLAEIVLPKEEPVKVVVKPVVEKAEVDSTVRQKDTVAVPVPVKEEPVKEEVKPEPYPKYTSGEMQAFLNSGDYDTRPYNSKVIFSSKMEVEVQNLRPDDIKPDDVALVCQKIQMGTWTSVTVVDVKYNSMNVITKIILNAHYPTEE